jgi:hypothetical protein
VRPAGAPGSVYGAPTSALKLSEAVRNATLDSRETTIGTAPTLEVWSGVEPDSMLDTPAGTLLATFTLPSDWMAAATGGVKEMTGSWSGTASATGDQTFFRILDSSAVPHAQGSCSGTGGGGLLQLNTATITSAQTVAVTVFSWTEANADG